MDYIISWFYSESSKLSSKYPQVGADSKSKKFQDTYWRCIIDFYYSSIIKNSAIKHLFYSNMKDLPLVDGFDVKNFFNENHIEFRHLDLTILPPEDWHGAWRNQFYVFDILRDCKKFILSEDVVAILDSDCIINKNLSPFFNDIQTHGSLVYPYGYDANHIINGLSKNDMRMIYKKFYNESIQIDYYGGELVALRGDKLQEVLDEFGFIWKENYKLYENKSKKLTEEAHFLSLIYHKLNLVNIVNKNYIKRIWNSPKFRNLKENDRNIFILHLPAQKLTGFKYFFNKFVKQRKSYNENDIEKIFYLSKNKKIFREIKDMFTKVLFRFM